ncbi:unnamed protein product [Ceratitis capitata]|uniref:(Mediterranean fruit fly) hypothetical protein n=1 Tax=Ceratitis capitata TaxID=7213 RepID=A0A811TYH1_CERCA|nr:unnamed protein product [Ceratitis capitata]
MGRSNSRIVQLQQQHKLCNKQWPQCTMQRVGRQLHALRHDAADANVMMSSGRVHKCRAKTNSNSTHKKCSTNGKLYCPANEPQNKNCHSDEEKKLSNSVAQFPKAIATNAHQQ